jgi:nicotinamide mononucleotide transporter
LDYTIEFIEWTAVITALIYVYLASVANRLCFLFGLISSVLLVYICFTDHLYFDTFINIYYIVMSVVGWYLWQGDQEILNVREMSGKTFLVFCLVGLVVFLGLGYAFDQYTGASMAYIDSFTTVFAVIATWMMVERFLENWIIWIVADAIAIYLYMVKGHYPIALLFLVYTVIAVFGYYNWKRILVKT